MKQTLLCAALVAACGFAWAKIPPPVLDDAAKAKAEEAKAKTAWQAKVDAFQLCKAQDRAVADYRKSSPGAPGAPGAKAMPMPAKAPAAPAAAAASGTPAPNVGAAAVPVAACADPGPFAYTPPGEKPLEASGAHSPPGTAKSPPSVNKTSGEMAPAAKKKS